MKSLSEGFVSAQANFRVAKVKSGGTPDGRSQNPLRTRQAVRGVREMFKNDGLI